ncbi:MAG: DUF3833 family protein [Allosphingosinicella sp.]
MFLPFLLGGLLLVQSAALTPEQFFTGRTQGAGTVNIILSGRHGVRSQSRGRMERGALLIDQVVEEEGKPARRRSWRLVRNGANGFTGTLSDARGRLTGTVAGNVLHLRYRLAEGPSVEQWITLHPGGRTAHNRMVFKRFGLTVATYEETIRRVD